VYTQKTNTGTDTDHVKVKLSNLHKIWEKNKEIRENLGEIINKLGK